MHRIHFAAKFVNPVNFQVVNGKLIGGMHFRAQVTHQETHTLSCKIK